MVTREKPAISFFRLHFVDPEGNETYQSVTSKNLSTLRYYAKKIRQQRNWYLRDFYEVMTWQNKVWLLKYIVNYKITNSILRMYFRNVNHLAISLEILEYI